MSAEKILYQYTISYTVKGHSDTFTAIVKATSNKDALFVFEKNNCIKGAKVIDFNRIYDKP
jgi:hypothetical protein